MLKNLRGKWPKFATFLSGILSARKNSEPVTSVNDGGVLAKSKTNSLPRVKGNPKLLPKVLASTGDRAVPRSGDRKHTGNLGFEIGKRLLTPATRDFKGAAGALALAKKKGTNNLPSQVKYMRDDKTTLTQPDSQLSIAIRRVSPYAGIDEKGTIRMNPRAVEAMMGYGIGWVDMTCDDHEPHVLMSPEDVESCLPVFTLIKPCGTKDQIKALGNAIVPQCAARSFDRIIELETEKE